MDETFEYISVKTRICDDYETIKFYNSFGYVLADDVKVDKYYVAKYPRKGFYVEKSGIIWPIAKGKGKMHYLAFKRDMNDSNIDKYHELEREYENSYLPIKNKKRFPTLGLFVPFLVLGLLFLLPAFTHLVLGILIYFIPSFMKNVGSMVDASSSTQVYSGTNLSIMSLSLLFILLSLTFFFVAFLDLTISIVSIIVGSIVNKKIDQKNNGKRILEKENLQRIIDKGVSLSQK